MKDRMTKMLFLTTLFVVPSVFSSQTGDIGLLPQLMMLCMCSLFLLFFLDLKGRKRSLSAVLLIFLAFLAVNIISVKNAINGQEWLFSIARLSILATFFFITHSIVTRRAGLRFDIAGAIALCAGVHAIIGILQYYGVKIPFIPVATAGSVSTMANKNLFASFLFLCSPFVLYRCIVAWRSKILLFGGILVLCGLAIFVSQCKAVWLGMAVGSIAVLITLLFNRRWKAATLLAMVGVVGLLCVFFLFKDIVINQLSIVNLHWSIKPRLAIWSQTIELISDHPVFGTGSGNWKIAFPGYGWDAAGMTHCIRPHNDFLWVMAETGIVGLLLYASLFLVSIRQAVKQAKDCLFGRECWSYCLIYGLVGFMVVSFFDFPYERIPHMMLFIVILASSMYPFSNYADFSKREHEGKTYSIPGASLTVSIIGMIICLCGGLLISRMESEIAAMDGVRLFQRGKFDESKACMLRARTPFYTIDPYTAPVDWHLGNIAVVEGDNEAAFYLYQEAAFYHPSHIHVLSNLGAMYYRFGFLDAALETTERALQLAPEFEAPLLNLPIIKKALQSQAQEDHPAQD